MRSRKMMWMRSAFVAVAIATGVPALAANWNESSNGDLSGNRSAPSQLTLTNGNNLIDATTGGGDLEYLRLNVPAGARIDSLFLRNYSGNDGIAFIGIQAGPVVTEDPNSGSASNLLGYAHFGTFAGNVGANLLPSMSTAPGAQGFTPPLTGSTYTLWIQQLGAPTTYRLDAVVTPEPAGVLTLGAAAAFACLRRRRTR